MQKKTKHSVILAAGTGSRLRYAYPDQLKPLVPVGKIEILLRTIRSHEIAGYSKIVIVIGWQAEALQKAISFQYKGESELIFVYNKDYKLQNGISLLTAKTYLPDEFLLTMADHIIDDNIMQMAKIHYPPKDGATLFVDYKLSSIFDMEDATKVYENNGFIVNIGKTIKTYNCVDTGVFIGTKALIDSIAEIYNRKGDAALSDGVQVLANAGKMEAFDIKDSFWQDVDTPEMLAHAEKLLKNKKIIN